MKKAYMVSLDAEKVEELRASGVENLSGWLNEQIKDNLDSTALQTIERMAEAKDIEAELAAKKEETRLRREALVAHIRKIDMILEEEYPEWRDMPDAELATLRIDLSNRIKNEVKK